MAPASSHDAYLEQRRRSMSHHYSGPNWGFPYGDARLDLADLYVFPKPGDADKSILIMNVHPSVRDFLDGDPLAPTTTEPFATEAVYEFKIDTDGDAVADIAYRVCFSSTAGGAQSATLRRAEGKQAAGMGDDGQTIVEGAPVSTGREALVTQVGHYRFFAGFAHALEHTGGYAPEEATLVARTLLPEILSYDPTRPASFPDNGRTLTDDAADVFLAVLTNRKITEDK